MFYSLYKNFWILTRNERRLLLAAGLIFFTAALFISINAYYRYTIERPAEGGSLKEGLIGQPAFVNPLAAASNVDKDLIQIIFSSLDDLAKDYRLSKDNRSWTVTLKDNLRWSDGQPLTADDILFTLKIIQDPSYNHPLYSVWRGVVTEKLNDNEVRFSLKSPYVFLIDNLKDLKIAPAHIFKNIPPTNFRLSRYNLEPVGSGPYKFKNFQTRRDGFITSYTLIPNELYFGSKSFIAKIVFKFYEDKNKLIQAFNQKEINAAAGLDSQSLRHLRISHKTITINLPNYYAIFLNSDAQPFFKDSRVRQALALAVNKEKIIKKIFYNQAVIIDGPLPPSIDGYDRSLYQSRRQFDLTAAANLLEEAGWTKDKNGVRMEINLVVPQLPFLEETAKEIKAEWSKIGIKLNLIVLETDEINKTVLRTRNYEAILFGNILKRNPDVFSFWHSSEQFYPGRNLALYDNRKVDNLLESIRQDFNRLSRQRKLSRLQKIIADDQPAIFLFSPNYFYAIPKNLQGFNAYFAATPADRFEKINKWHLQTSRIFW